MAPQPGARRVGREKGPVVVSCGGLRAGPRQGSAGRPQFSLSASEPRQRGKRGTERPSNPEALHKVSLAPKFERRRGGDTHCPGLHRASSGSAARPHSSPQGVPAERFWGDGLSRWAGFLPRAAHLPHPSTGQAPRTTFHASLPYRPLHRRPTAPAVGHTQVQTLGPALKVLAHPTAKCLRPGPFCRDPRGPPSL